MTTLISSGALVVVALAVVARVTIAVGSGSTPWWRWAHTVAVVCVAGAIMSLLNGEALGALLGVPMIWALVLDLCLFVSAGASVAYGLALRHDHPDPATLAVVGVATLLMSSVLVIVWVMAPFEGPYVADVASIPGTEVYQWVRFAPLTVYSLAATATFLWLAAHHAVDGDWSRTTGLGLAAAGFAMSVVALATHSWRIGRGADTSDLLVVADTVSILAGATLAGATLILSLGPLVDLHVRDAGLRAGLTPLWRALTRRYPTVRLRMPWRRFGLERRLFEIHDALTLLPVGEASRLRHPDDPVRAVAHAVHHPPTITDPTLPRASDVLPTVGTPSEDAEQLRALAQAHLLGAGLGRHARPDDVPVRHRAPGRADRRA